MNARNAPQMLLAFAVGAALIFGCFLVGVGSAGAGVGLGSASASTLPDAAPLIDTGSAAGSAVAAVAPVLPDPIAQPAESASLLVGLWKGGAIAPFLILVLYFAALFLGRWVGWLKDSKRRAALTGSTLALLATLAEPASRGTTPTMAMLLAGLGAAIALFVKMDGADASASGA